MSFLKKKEKKRTPFWRPRNFQAASSRASEPFQAPEFQRNRALAAGFEFHSGRPLSMFNRGWYATYHFAWFISDQIP